MVITDLNKVYEPSCEEIGSRLLFQATVGIFKYIYVGKGETALFIYNAFTPIHPDLILVFRLDEENKKERSLSYRCQGEISTVSIVCAHHRHPIVV